MRCYFLLFVAVGRGLICDANRCILPELCMIPSLVPAVVLILLISFRLALAATISPTMSHSDAEPFSFMFQLLIVTRTHLAMLEQVRCDGR